MIAIIERDIAGEKASLSTAQRSKIVVLRGEGYSQRKISEKYCVSRKAVQTAIKKFKN